MKIIVNGTILDDKPTGLGVYTYQTLKRLPPEDYVLFSCMNTQVHDRVYVTKLCKPYPYGKLGGMIRFFVNQFYFPLVARKFDVAYLPTPHGSLFLRNQVVTIHDLLALHFPSQHKLQYLYYRFFLGFILRRSRAIISISDSTKKDIMKFYGISSDKINVVPNGFDPSEFCVDGHSVEYIRRKFGFSGYVFSVGSSYSHKNIDRLVKAFLSNPISKGKSLVITGSIGENQRKIISRYNANNVHFIGFVDRKDLPHLYSSADCMVYPSLYEGFGFPPLEAMACGCPVIVSNSSSLPEVCGDAAIYIDPMDTAAIGSAINKVCTNQQLRRIYTEKGYKRVKRFTWERAVDDIEKCIRRL